MLLATRIRMTRPSATMARCRDGAETPSDLHPPFEASVGAVAGAGSVERVFTVAEGLRAVATPVGAPVPPLQALVENMRATLAPTSRPPA
jgi:hypothetical protein